MYHQALFTHLLFAAVLLEREHVLQLAAVTIHKVIDLDALVFVSFLLLLFFFLKSVKGGFLKMNIVFANFKGLVFVSAT